MRKKILSLLLASVLIITALCGLSVSADDAPARAVSVYSGTRDYDFWMTAMSGTETDVTIMTADQLMAFAELTLGFNFEGWTIRLGADMVINTGDASEWATTAPKYGWKCSTTWSYRFAGNFDGQGHVISGLYSNYGQECGLFGTITGGNTIQNVSVINSYFRFKSENESNDVCLMGGIVGYIDGNGANRDGWKTIIKNVYVNATLYTDCAVPTPNSMLGVGGIVGVVGNTSYQDLVFENVVFEGSITSSYRHLGGILGRARFFNTGNVSIKNCSVNAEIKSTNTDEPNVGGLVGVSNANVTIEDCFVKGTIEVAKKQMTSALIGFENVQSNLHVAVNNVLLAVTPIPTGEESNVIIRTMLLNYYINSGYTLIVSFDNVQYESGLYTYPEEWKHIDKTTGDNLAIGADFTATGAAAENLKGQAVFTGWTAVENDYPIPAKVTVPDIDIVAYQNAVDTTPSGQGEDPGENPGENPGEGESSESTTGKTEPKTEEPTTEKPKTNESTTEKPATEEPATEAAAKKKSGCGSTVGTAGISALALISVMAIAFSKKKERN